MQRIYVLKMIGNVSDWLSNAGGALIKVTDFAGSTFTSNNYTTARQSTTTKMNKLR